MGCRVKRAKSSNGQQISLLLLLTIINYYILFSLSTQSRVSAFNIPAGNQFERHIAREQQQTLDRHSRKDGSRNGKDGGTGAQDDISEESESTAGVVRVYTLHNRCSGKHVTISGHQVHARGSNTDEFARIRVTTATFRIIRIQSDVTNDYLCFNNRGRLQVKKSGAGDIRCLFEELDNDYYTEFRSVANNSLYIGFNRAGLRLDGDRETFTSGRRKPTEEPTTSVLPPPSTVQPATDMGDRGGKKAGKKDEKAETEFVDCSVVVDQTTNTGKKSNSPTRAQKLKTSTDVGVDKRNSTSEVATRRHAPTKGNTRRRTSSSSDAKRVSTKPSLPQGVVGQNNIEVEKCRVVVKDIEEASSERGDQTVTSTPASGDQDVRPVSGTRSKVRGSKRNPVERRTPRRRRAVDTQSVEADHRSEAELLERGVVSSRKEERKRRSEARVMRHAKHCYQFTKVDFDFSDSPSSSGSLTRSDIWGAAVIAQQHHGAPQVDYAKWLAKFKDDQLIMR